MAQNGSNSTVAEREIIIFTPIKFVREGGPTSTDFKVEVLIPGPVRDRWHGRPVAHLFRSLDRGGPLVEATDSAFYLLSEQGERYLPHTYRGKPVIWTFREWRFPDGRNFISLYPLPTNGASA